MGGFDSYFDPGSKSDVVGWLGWYLECCGLGGPFSFYFLWTLGVGGYLLSWMMRPMTFFRTRLMISLRLI